MTERLTQKKIDELVEQIERKERTKGEKIFDAIESGLIVFVGAKVVSFRYRQIEQKRETMLTLGNSRNLTLAGARKLVQTIKQKKEERRRQRVLGRLLGLSVPAEEKPLTEEEEIKELLPKIKVSEVVESFLEKKKKEGVSVSTTRQLNLYSRLIIEGLGGTETEKLLTKDVVEFLENQMPSRKAKMAGFLRAAFDYAVASGSLEQSPLRPGFEKSLTKKKEETHIAAPKTLTAYFSELNSCFAEANSVQKRCFLLLLQLLPVRLSEITSWTWGNIDINENTITFKQQKVNRTQTLPLNSLTKSILRTVNPVVFDSLLKTEFPKTKSKEKIFSLSATTIRRIFAKCQCFSPHSVRSCFSTFLLDLGPEFAISRDDVERCLGHSVDKYAGAYQRSQEIERKKRILDIWSRLICSSQSIRELYFSNSGYPVSDSRFPSEFLTDEDGKELELQRQIQNLKDSI